MTHEPKKPESTPSESAEPPEVLTAEPSTLAELQAQLEERQQSYLRVLADYQNFKRRAIENEARARDHGVSHVARAIVPVLENMDLALGHDLRSLDAGKLADAVELLRSNLLKALAQCGVERIAPLPGDEFDPHFHEAVLQQTANKIAPGRIANCLQAGYRFGDVPLRSAKVAVTPQSDP